LARSRHSYTQSAMPTYEYRCEKGHTFEVMQRMSEDSLTECTICGAPVQRVFHPVAVHFKGSGFYTTDYGSKKRPAGGSASDSSSSSDGAASKKKDEPKKKTETKSSSSSASSSSSSASSSSSGSSDS
jgi:putative FmdB family regulatory protein